MRKNMFGDAIIDSKEDDLGIHIDTDGAYVIVNEPNEDGMHYFEIMDNIDGEPRGHSDSIFESFEDAKEYLSSWFSGTDIQKNF